MFWWGDNSTHNIIYYKKNYVKDLSADSLIGSSFNFVQNEEFKKVPIVNDTINEATLKWSQGCPSRGPALHVLGLESLQCQNRAR